MKMASKEEMMVDAMKDRVLHRTCRGRSNTPPEMLKKRMSRTRRTRRRPGVSNPCVSSDMERIMEATFTEDRLCEAAGTRQLRGVTRLEIVVDSSKTSVEGIWTSVPSLRTLVLDGSKLASFRDLGLGLRHLHVFSLQRSRVTDLDGIGGALSGLKELHLADNQVSDVTPLACHSHLQVLDLGRNHVDDIKALEILGTIPRLCSLDLRQNPLTDSLAEMPDLQERGIVHFLIPQLEILDGAQLSDEMDIIDAGTIMKANERISAGRPRGLAAWVNDRLPNRSTRERHVYPSRRRTVEDEDMIAGEALSADSGILHWDSPLTQGGGIVFSGNPSSAIRKHKMMAASGPREGESSLQQVLATLDLAEEVDRCSRARDVQQLEARVAEWRQEAFSEAVAQDGTPQPPVQPHALAAASSGATCRSRSVSPLPRHVPRRCNLGRHPRDRERERWASPTVSVAASTGYPGSLGRGDSTERPWTTGGFGRSKSVPRGARRDKAADSTNVVVDDREEEDPIGGEHGFRRLKASRRPGEHLSPEYGSTSSWHSMWRSLQTTRSMKAPKGARSAGEVGQVGSNVSGHPASSREIYIQGQRETGTAIGHTTHKDARGNREHVLSDAGSTEETSSASSDEACDRAEIKRRALHFGTVAHDCVHPTTRVRTEPESKRQSRSTCSSPVASSNTSPRRCKLQVHSVSRRPLRTMDESSGSGSDADNGSEDTLTRAGNPCGEATSTSGNLAVRSRSLHASRRLGFDLRKSLAAIDEWTLQASNDDIPETLLEGNGGGLPSFLMRNAKESRTQDQGDASNRRSSDHRDMAISASRERQGNNTLAAAPCMALSDSDSVNKQKAVLSVAEANGALGIRRGSIPPVYPMTTVVSDVEATNIPDHPSPTEIKATDNLEGSATRGQRRKMGTGGAVRTKKPAAPGLAVNMSGVTPEGLMRQQPWIFPESRTTDGVPTFSGGTKVGGTARSLRAAEHSRGACLDTV